MSQRKLHAEALPHDVMAFGGGRGPHDAISALIKEGFTLFLCLSAMLARMEKAASF